MGVSAAQFKSAGQSTQHYIPGVYSRRNNIAGIAGVGTGNLCIIGPSLGGEPLKLLKFADVADAKETLAGGDLLSGVAHAFNGSTAYVPQYVYGMRVDKGTKSGAEFKSGGGAVISVKSFDWGAQMNQIKKWFKKNDDGTAKVTVSYKGEEVTVDKIEKKSFSILYSGTDGTAGGPACKIEGGKLTIESETEGERLEIPFEEVETLDALVARINDNGNYIATLIDGAAGAKCAELDHVSTPVTLSGAAHVFKSDVQALADALKSIAFIGEVEVGDSRVMPEDDTGFVYFTGAQAGTSTAEDYMDALEALEKEDVQIIATPSTDRNVHSLIADHCISMSSVSKKRERTFFVGLPSSATIAEGVEAAKGLNTEFGSVIIDGANANNPLTGAAENISPALLACKMAGIESAVTPSVPLTNKMVKVNAFLAKRKDKELEEMIAGGVMPFGENDNGELVCIRAMTTYQGDNLIMNERSMIRSVLFMDRDLRKAFSARTGTNTAPSEASIMQVLLNKAAQWFLDDLITKDDGGSNVFNIKVRFDGDKCYLTFDRYIRAPNNFTFITATNRVYTSTVEV